MRGISTPSSQCSADRFGRIIDGRGKTTSWGFYVSVSRFVVHEWKHCNAEVENMSASTSSNCDEYGFEYPEDFDHTEYAKFKTSYSPVLTQQSEAWFSFMTSNSKLKKIVRKGIPMSLRPYMWIIVSGVPKLKEKYGSDLFNKMLNESIDKAVKKSINADVPRTFPDNIFFNQDSNNQSSLSRILYAFAAHKPHVGYCQGLNYIAGLLLVVTKSEEISFWLLLILVEEKLPDYYCSTMEGVIVDIEVFSRLVKQKFPDVSTHINNLDLSWAVISTKWFICLFAEVLPIETTLRVWDCLFYEGSKILFRVGLMLIKHHRNELMACDSVGSLSECFKSIIQQPFSLNCHIFIEKMFTDIGSLPSSLITNLRKQVSAERQKDPSSYEVRKR